MSTGESDFKQLADFPPTGQVSATDLIYSATGTAVSVEQATTVAQLQTFMMAPIANSTLQSVTSLSGAETVPIGRSGLFQTSITKIAQWLIGTFQGFTQSGTGAVARTLQNKLQEVISVKDFGATGNGTTDDTAAIQAAVNAASGNSVVYAPAGTYLVGVITVPASGMFFIGSGIQTQFITETTNQSAIFSAIGCAHLSIRNARFTGNGTATSGNGYGLYISEIDDVDLDFLWVDGFGNNSIFFDNSNATQPNMRPRLGTIKCFNAQNALGSSAENAAINFYGPWQDIHLRDIHVQAAATNPIQNGFNISEITGNTVGWKNLTIDTIRVYGVGKRGVSLDNENPTGTFSSGIVKIGNLHVENTGWEGFKSKNVDVIQIANGMALNCEKNGPEIAGNLQGSFFFNGPNDVQAKLVVQGGMTDAVRVVGRAAGTPSTGAGQARWQLDILSSNNGTATYGGRALTVQVTTQSVDARVQSYNDNGGIDVISSTGNLAPISIKLQPTIKNPVNNGVNIAGISGLPIGPVFINHPDISQCGQFGIVATYATRLEISGGQILDSGISSTTNNAGIRIANVTSVNVHDVYSNNSVGTTQSYGLSIGSGIVTAHVHDNDFSNNTSGPVSYAAPTTLRAHTNHGWWDEGTGYFGDTSTTVTYGVNHLTNVFNVPLTANRTVSFSTNGAPYGFRFRIVRAASSTGSYSLQIQGGTATTSLAPGQWCDMEYIAGSNGWTEVAAGPLY
jgi:hypothetical protein